MLNVEIIRKRDLEEKVLSEMGEGYDRRYNNKWRIYLVLNHITSSYNKQDIIFDTYSVFILNSRWNKKVRAMFGACEGKYRARATNSQRNWL